MSVWHEETVYKWYHRSGTLIGNTMSATPHALGPMLGGSVSRGRVMFRSSWIIKEGVCVCV